MNLIKDNRDDKSLDNKVSIIDQSTVDDCHIIL